tara:strand:- start:72 stop:545 length:474 start_codon:yes stop_codon:yes gene_type:complete
LINNKYFRVNWVLINELAIGPAPINQKHLGILYDLGIKGIFSLCSTKEVPSHNDMLNIFEFRRFVLPDHKTGRIISTEELISSLAVLEDLKRRGPVFIHCVAAMERSPLVCISWLIKKHKLSLDESLSYLMQAHSGTNPLPEQLNVLRSQEFINAII